MATITIEVDEIKLKEMVEHLKAVEPEYKVHDPLKLLELIIKTDLENYVGVLDRFIDGGGNSLIGDCLREEDCVGIVEEVRDE